MRGFGCRWSGFLRLRPTLSGTTSICTPECAYAASVTAGQTEPLQLRLKRRPNAGVETERARQIIIRGRPPDGGTRKV